MVRCAQTQAMLAKNRVERTCGRVAQARPVLAPNANGEWA